METVHLEKGPDKSEYSIVQMVGVISDTHGLLRPEAAKALGNVDLIVHAGDVGSPEIMESLRELAPVVAIRGNMDGGEWAGELKRTELVEIERTLIYVIHDIQSLDLDAQAAGIRVVVYGHSHTPAVKEEQGVLYLNPGSAGPRRFNLPVTVAHLTIAGKNTVSVEIIDLGAI
ncbi:MAG: metallophosphoesterase family protein [Pseudomonadota bacterium]